MGSNLSKSAGSTKALAEIPGEVFVCNSSESIHVSWQRPRQDGQFIYRIKYYRISKGYIWNSKKLKNVKYCEKSEINLTDAKPGKLYEAKVGIEMDGRHGPTKKSPQIVYAPLVIKNLSAELVKQKIRVSWDEIKFGNVTYEVTFHDNTNRRSFRTEKNHFDYQPEPQSGSVSIEVRASNHRMKGAKRCTKINVCDFLTEIAGVVTVRNLSDSILVDWPQSPDGQFTYRVKAYCREEGWFTHSWKCKDVKDVKKPKFNFTSVKKDKIYRFKVCILMNNGCNGPAKMSPEIKFAEPSDNRILHATVNIPGSSRDDNFNARSPQASSADDVIPAPSATSLQSSSAHLLSDEGLVKYNVPEARENISDQTHLSHTMEKKPSLKELEVQRGHYLLSASKNPWTMHGKTTQPPEACKPQKIAQESTSACVSPQNPQSQYSKLQKSIEPQQHCSQSYHDKIPVGENNRPILSPVEKVNGILLQCDIFVKPPQVSVTFIDLNNPLVGAESHIMGFINDGFRHMNSPMSKLLTISCGDKCSCKLVSLWPEGVSIHPKLDQVVLLVHGKGQQNFLILKNSHHQPSLQLAFRLWNETADKELFNFPFEVFLNSKPVTPSDDRPSGAMQVVHAGPGSHVVLVNGSVNGPTESTEGPSLITNYGTVNEATVKDSRLNTGSIFKKIG